MGGAALNPGIAIEPKVGPSLPDLASAGRVRETLVVAEPKLSRRCPFFFRTQGEHTLAKYGDMFADPAFQTYRSAEFIACRLRGVTVLGTDGVLLHEGAALADTVSHIMTWAPGSLTENFRPKEYLRLRRPLSVAHRATEGIFMIGFTGSWRNYAHWMQETLPKLTTFQRLARQYPALKIVLPRFSSGSFQQQTLTLLGITSAMIFPLADDDVVTFDDAWVATQADIWSVPDIVVAAARQLAGAATPPNGDADGAAIAGTGERIYIHREGASRAVANFAELLPLLERHGFAVVTLERHPLATQIALMRRARYVIAEHGAGLANIMFCQPGARVLELFNPVCVQPAFWSVASACQLEFGYLVGTHMPLGGEGEPTWNSAYAVPPGHLDQAIAAMCGEPRVVLDTTPPVVQREEMAAVIFTGQHEFQIGEVCFATAEAAGAISADRILVYKDRGFIDSYIETLPPLRARRAFEFGSYQGGSAIFLTLLLDLEKFVCIDHSPPVPEFAKAIDRIGLTSRVKPYFGILQDSADDIRNIIEAEFSTEPPDLIIDDASHLYEFTKQSFQIAFPYLKDGGYYIIEDWSWAHWPENQTEAHGWWDRPATTNLILELVVLLPSSDMIEWITVRQGYVIIKKQRSRYRSGLLNIGDTLRTRGKPMAKI